MGQLLNNDTNYRIVAGEDLDVEPVVVGDDGKVYSLASGKAGIYVGWTVQETATGEVAAVIRNGKVSVAGKLSSTVTEGVQLAYGSDKQFKEAASGDVVVGFVPFGGLTGPDAPCAFIEAHGGAVSASVSTQSFQTPVGGNGGQEPGEDN